MAISENAPASDPAHPPLSWRPYVWIGLLFLLLYGLPQSWHVTGVWSTSTLGYLVNAWAHREDAGHGWLILPIAAAVVWYKREKLAILPRSSHSGGFWVMAFAILMHLGDVMMDIDGPSPLSIPIFLAGAIWYLFGTAWLRELAFPLAYLTFMVPVPGGLTQVVTFPLRTLATDSSRALAEKFGVYTIGAGMNIEFVQPHGYEYIRLTVADPCSGIHSIMAIKALHAITAYLSRLKLGWKWVLFMLALPITLAANVLRMTLIIAICAYVSKKVGMLFHDYSPYVLFLFVFLILISIGRGMEWATRYEPTTVKRPSPALFLLSRVFLGVCIFLAVSGFPFLIILAGHTKAAVMLLAIVAAGIGASRLIGVWVQRTDRPNRRPALALPAILLAGALCVSVAVSVRPPTLALKADISKIPTRVGDWESIGDIPADPETMKQIEADSFVQRVYRRPDGQQVEYMVVYRQYGRREFAHRPDQCYPAGGYISISKDMTTLPWANREDMAVHWLFDGHKVLRNDGGEGVPTTTVTYLFVSGNRTESDFIKQQLWMAFERLMPNKNGWTFIRLSSPRITTDEDALAAQKDFMRQMEGPTRQVITTDPATAGPVGSVER